jgi:hypothetical protein
VHDGYAPDTPGGLDVAGLARLLPA